MRAPGGGGRLVGTGRLVRLALRRDRVRLSIWVAAIVGLVLVSAASLPPLYPDRASQEQYVALASGNPALKAFAGPGSGFDDPNIGVILVNETQLWGAVCVALMVVFLLIRHTRGEEDEERADVVRSGVVGRHAPLAAAIVEVGAAVAVVAIASAVGFVALGYAVAGSVSLAASFAVFGWAFVGVAAVAAQVASSARAALGYSAAVLGAMFALRAVGDAGSSWLRWTSPLGWAQSGEAFAGERWWPLALCAVLGVVLVAVARALADRRDLGAGMLVAHRGPPRASRGLVHPLGLAVRLQRGAIVGWVAGMAVFGALYGSIGEDIGEFIEDNQVYADIVAQLQGVDVTDSFFATALAMLALFASGFSISSSLRPRGEEQAGRAALLLAGPRSRVGWAASYLTVAGVGTVAIIAAGGLGTGVGYALVSGDAGQVLRMVGASLVTVPAALVLAGVAVALYGLAPRAALAAWAVLAGTCVVVFFGELLGLPMWVRDLSPFTHLPAVPAQPMRWGPVLALLATASALAGAGLWGLQRRDID